MNLKEARKLAEQKPAANRLTIKLDYDKWLVLPYKEGIKLLETLESAEVIKGAYSHSQQIHSLDSLRDLDLLTTKVMGNDDYCHLKMAGLLGINPSDIPQIESGELELAEAQKLHF